MSLLEFDTVDAFLRSKNFRKRPGMYIGSNGIMAFYHFISGLGFAQDLYQIDEAWPLFGFNDWVANQYDWSASTAGWARIILKEECGNEDKALKTFFQLYDKFCQFEGNDTARQEALGLIGGEPKNRKKTVDTLPDGTVVHRGGL